jgi:exopolysaccharide biosynthesis operon protein EpsL
MNKNTPPWQLSAGVLAALLIPCFALADENDAFSLVTSAGWQYQDNLFFLPDGREPNIFGSVAPRGDHVKTVNVGLKFDKTLGRQRFTGNVSRSSVRYSNIGQFDYDGLNMLADWQWRIGNDLSGGLRYTKKRSLQGFSEFRTSDPAKNLVTSEAWRFDATYKMDAYWALFASVARDTRVNALLARRANDADIDSAEGGVRYTTRGGTAFEVLGRQTDGDYPFRLPGLNQTNSFSQKNVEARVRWQPLGHSRLSALVGQSTRTHANIPERDYDDVYGRLTWEWQTSGHTGMTFLAERQISAQDDVVSSYFRVTTLSVAPSWQPTGKLSVNGLVQFRSRVGQGETFYSQLDPATRASLGIGTTVREEDIFTLSVGSTWMIERNLSANAQIRHDRRDGNQEFYQYKANSVSAFIQYLF